MTRSPAACNAYKSSTVRSPWGVLIRVSGAKHAVSSRKIYSLQGLLALMRPSAALVCHSLIVVSNCTPAAAHCHAARAIFSHRSAAGTHFGLGLPSLRRGTRSHVWPASRRAKKSFGIRTELFEFCPETVPYAFESQLVSYVSTWSSL